MKIIEITPVSKNKSMYTSIHADDDRVMIIDDERGGRIELKGKEIGELYKSLKPTLAG